MAALNAVIAERHRQDALWGEQNHDPFMWLAILSEEVGEFAQEAMEYSRAVGSFEMLRRLRFKRLRTEAVQVAAVALAMVECLDRGKWKGGVK